MKLPRNKINSKKALFTLETNAYAHMLDFIYQSTLMTNYERNRWVDIEYLTKNNPEILKNYFMILKTESEVRLKMSKREELLSLLNQTEKKIIRELIKGTPNTEIPGSVGISLSTASCALSSIYKKTKGLIEYGKKSKLPLLKKFLFSSCGFRKGDEIDISEDKIVTKSEELMKSKTTEDNKNNEANIENNTSVRIGKEVCDLNDRCLQIASVLNIAKRFLEGKCGDFYYSIGRILVDNPNSDLKNISVFKDAVIYKEAIEIINNSINKLTGEAFKNV